MCACESVTCAAFVLQTLVRVEEKKAATSELIAKIGVEVRL